MKTMSSKGKKSTIAVQIFLTSIVGVLAISAMFSGYEMFRDISTTREATDARLKTAAYGIREILPIGYNDRAIRGEISDSEYETLRIRLNDYRDRIGVSHLYALAKYPDGKIRFTLDADNIEKFPECDNPTKLVQNVFASRKIQVGQGFDREVDESLRSAVVPNFSPTGRFFATGADISLKSVKAEIFHVSLNFLLLLGFGMFLTGGIAYIISKRISAPIRALSDFTIKLAKSNFSPDVLPDNKISTGSKEVASLEKNIGLMRKNLSVYIEHLKAAVQAKESAESELKIAGQIQQSFLPKCGVDTPEFSIFGIMKPAREAGGDLFSHIKLDDGRVWFAIGDVSGKGMPAAMFMARAITLAKSCAENASSLCESARLMNEQLCDNNDTCMFVSFLSGIYDPKSHEMKIVNCGHNPPYTKKYGQKPRIMKISSNSILGVIEEARFTENTITFRSGDAVMFYTDGVNEATASDGCFFGDENTAKLLEDDDCEAEKFCPRTMKKIEDFEKDAEQSDDITILYMRIK